MAKYTVTFSCGHTEKIVLTGKKNYIDWKLEQLKDELCPECKKALKQQKAEKELADAKAKLATKNLKLARLQGSEKQIAWAEKIRTIFIAALIDEKNDDFISLVNKFISAEWWIDKNNWGAANTYDNMLSFIIEQEKQAEAKKQEDEDIKNGVLVAKEVLYKNYKNYYYDYRIVEDSYNSDTKTIQIYVPADSEKHYN